MGVLGIVPFLLKKCPQVIESIPNRFHALEGKTIAVDATLVTQRLHFTPDPRPCRHVLGWHQLIAELRQHGIKIICVFDGRHRVPAKRNELERRKQMRLQAQVRGAWEKSRHERLLSLTEALQGLESLSKTQQQAVLNSLKDQSGQSLPPKLEDKQANATLALDLSAATTQQDALVGSANNILEQLPEPFLPVEESGTLVPDSTSSVATGTSSGTAICRNSRNDRSSSVVPPSSAVGEKSSAINHSLDNVFTTSPGSARNESSSESVTPNFDEQAALPSGIIPMKQDMVLDPLESYAAPKISAKPTTHRDASLVAQLSDLALSKDSAASGPDAGDDQATTDKQEQAKSELDFPAGVNDSHYLSKVIRHLHEHYARTSTTGADGFIPAWSDEPEAANQSSVPISRVQLKYTQEESKLWEQIVPKSNEAEVDVARVVEQAKQLASVELPKDEPEPESAEQEIEQVAEQQGDETAPISEWAATLEEQSGHMVASLMRRSSPPTTATYTESRLILEAMGVPCIESPMNYEAEALASSLVINGLADLVGSEDTDVLMYNAPLLRHMTNRKVPLQIIPPSTETSLDLSRSAFVDAAILMGTDFVRRVKKIGPNTAYRLMQKHGSIERMLEEEPKLRPPDVADYLEQVKVARLIFSSLPPTPSPASIAQGEWNEQAVQETMAHFGLEKYIGEELIPGALSDNYFKEEPKEFS